MKKIFTLFTLAFTSLFQYTNAQIQEYNVNGDSLTGCQNNVSGYVVNGPLAEIANIEISWGDGTSDNVPLDIASNTYGSFSKNHTYAVPGTYSVDVQFYSTVNAAYAGTGQQLDLLALSQSSCGYLNGFVYQTNPMMSHYNVPFDCTGANGITTTITPATMNWSDYIGLDPSNAPYTVSINDAWLTTNGYIQASADQTISSFDANGMSNTQITFIVSCNVPDQDPDFDVSYIWASNFVAPLQTGSVYVNICNTACSDTSDVEVSLYMPEGFVPNTTDLTNAVINGTTLTFDIPNLSNCSSLSIPFTFPGNTAAGTEFCFAIALYHPDDTDFSDNYDTICGTVLNSYDPNAKEVDHAEQINPAVRETLEYMIHFQNDGNYPAVNVEIIDTLSTNLDLSTFRLIGSKHGISYNLDPATRIVKFMFNQIYLAPSDQNLEASQGFVIYSIKEVTGLGDGDEIENTAYIYFDYNPAIITNTAYNVNVTLGTNEHLKEIITLYPNPTSSIFQVSGADLEEIRIFDMTGKEVHSSILTNTNSVDVENLSNGIYTCVITSKTGVYQQKMTIKK